MVETSEFELRQDGDVRCGAFAGLCGRVAAHVVDEQLDQRLCDQLGGRPVRFVQHDHQIFDQILEQAAEVGVGRGAGAYALLQERVQEGERDLQRIVVLGAQLLDLRLLLAYCTFFTIFEAVLQHGGVLLRLAGLRLRLTREDALDELERQCGEHRDHGRLIVALHLVVDSTALRLRQARDRVDNLFQNGDAVVGVLGEDHGGQFESVQLDLVA